MMSDPLSWIPDELEAWAKRKGCCVDDGKCEPLSNGRCSVDGHEAWDFASNDYLGLANDPRVVVAARDALQSHGVGGRASPLVSGRSDLHLKLEQTLADFEGTSAAVLFPTGMAANMGTVAALAGSGDILFCDRLNHASLVDGCRASGATIRVYRHHDLDELAGMMSTTSGLRKFIVTDTVFSMDGDLAPLSELCELAERHNAAMIVDEAHGTGVFGDRGRGVVELLGVEERIAVRIGTLSKAVGAIGGFVTGSRALIDFLWNKARTQVYSTSLPPAVCAAAAEAIRIIKNEPERQFAAAGDGNGVSKSASQLRDFACPRIGGADRSDRFTRTQGGDGGCRSTAEPGIPGGCNPASDSA